MFKLETRKRGHISFGTQDSILETDYIGHKCSHAKSQLGPVKKEQIMANLIKPLWNKWSSLEDLRLKKQSCFKGRKSFQQPGGTTYARVA